jgi:hypothetical protein
MAPSPRPSPPLLASLLTPGLAAACTASVAQGPEASPLESALVVGLVVLGPVLLGAAGVWAAWCTARQDARRDG